MEVEIMYGGSGKWTQSHVAPVPPPANPEKPALPVTLPSPNVPDPRVQGLRGPKSNSRPLLRPQTLLLAAAIFPRENR